MAFAPAMGSSAPDLSARGRQLVAEGLREFAEAGEDAVRGAGDPLGALAGACRGFVQAHRTCTG